MAEAAPFLGFYAFGVSRASARLAYAELKVNFVEGYLC